MAHLSLRAALWFAGFGAFGFACSGKDPYRPGESVGVFHVTAKLVSTTCGPTPDPWEFEIRLRHERTTLYWVQGNAPISGTVDPSARAELTATATATLLPADPKTRSAACSLTRTDVLDVVLAPVPAPAADLGSTTSFRGTLTYRFAPTSGSECDTLVSGGDFDALPCAVQYTLDGVRTSDAK